MLTLTILAEEVIGTKMVPKCCIVPVKEIPSVCIAIVAEKMISSQMAKKFVLVQKACVAVFAQWVTPMTDLVRIALPPMECQLLAIVTASFG